MSASASWDQAGSATVTQWFAEAAEEASEQVFVDFTAGESYTYGEFDRLTNRLARGMSTLGIGRGDTVATMLDNTIYAVAGWIAANKTGAINVPVNTALKGEFLRHVLDDSRARVLLVEAHYAARLNALGAGLQHLDHIVVVGAGSRTDLPGTPVTIEQLLDHSDAPLDDPNTPRDLTTIIYTSGTTGVSKGCMISHNYAVHIARQELGVSDRHSAEPSYTCLPLFHLNAAIINVLATVGAKSKITIAPRFSLSGFWRDIRNSRARSTSLLGGMIPLLAKAPDSPDSLACRGQLRYIAGQPWPGDTQQIFRERFGVEMVGSQRYSMTEAFAVTSYRYGDGPPPPAGSSGRRNDNFDVRIFDDNDRELPPGEVGEIVVRPLHPNIMFDGYWQRPEATLDAFRNLWFHTGDCGRIDEDGYLWFADRKKDYIRRHGENISSMEVEMAVRAHPAVHDVAAHPVSSELSEDEVKICVIPVEGATLHPEEVFRWCADTMPHYAVPRYIEIVADLPRTPTGKVQKFLLRATGVTDTTWDREKAGLVVTRD
ncbi:AMP-binding protein [Rhodococcus sp. NPDC057014]|uniref:AMP-binding protein n=1 Tax=Rhodococcus sp. NPDC057014 TaxID=3346000 RepID=UPI003624C047